jgi:methionyl-tRNA formyltransferase
MVDELRIVIASYGPAQFRFLDETLTTAGHVPVAYLVSRSMRPGEAAGPDLLEASKSIVEDLPPGRDLLLPGSPDNLAGLLGAYRPDALLVFGFNWRLPADVLAVPRLGALNVHPSALPNYRGPSPVLWAIRNGDPCMGLTVHRMTGQIDAGPILAQVDDLPLPERVTRQEIWEVQQAALPALMDEALDRAARREQGAPQDEGVATYAGFPPPDWLTVTWQESRRSTHNQVRVLRYLSGGDGPIVDFQGRMVRVDHTSLTDDGGTLIECGDGSLWVTSVPVALAEVPGPLPVTGGAGSRQRYRRRAEPPN